MLDTEHSFLNVLRVSAWDHDRAIHHGSKSSTLTQQADGPHIHFLRRHNSLDYVLGMAAGTDPN